MMRVLKTNRTHVLILILLMLAVWAILLPASTQAAVEAPPPATKNEECEGECYTFELVGYEYDAAMNTTTLTWRITNRCKYGLSHVAFELPAGTQASAPTHGAIYTSPTGRQYQVENPTNNPFYSIKFETIGSGIADGESDLFVYAVPGNFDPNAGMKVQAKGGQKIDRLELTPGACTVPVTPEPTPEPTCEPTPEPTPAAPEPTLTCERIIVNYHRPLTNGDHINMTIRSGASEFQVNAYVDLNVAGGYNGLGLRFSDGSTRPLTQAEVESGIIDWAYPTHAMIVALNGAPFEVVFLQANHHDSWPGLHCGDEPTPVTPEPTPVTPEPTPVTPEPTPVTPEPTPAETPVGSLIVTKRVIWGAVTISEATFTICIQGPSFPDGNESGACHTFGREGGSYTWNNLTPGEYQVREMNVDADLWLVEGSGEVVTVYANVTSEHTITNTAIDVSGGGGAPTALDPIEEPALFMNRLFLPTVFR